MSDTGAPAPGPGFRTTQHGRIAPTIGSTPKDRPPKCGSLQSCTRRYVVRSDITWNLDCASNVGLCAARGAVFWPLIYQCSSITVPLCASRGNHDRAIFSVMPTVPTPILTGHYACNCISNDVGRCPVSVMPMIPIVFFNRRYTRFLVNFKPDFQLSIALLWSISKIFEIIHANPLAQNDNVLVQ